MKHSLILFITFVFCSFLGFTQSLIVPPVTLYATEDAHTYSGSTSTNYGTLGTMNVSVVSGPQVYRSYVKFDFSSIPTDAVITSAVLKFTPSGSENITNPSQLQLDLGNTNWYETGINHSSSISNNPLYTTLTNSTFTGGKRQFIVTDWVQKLVEESISNYGFRLKKTDETTVLNTTYFTREDATQSNRPQLVIQYYLRSYVSAATIVHTSSLSSTDGSISPTIANGSDATMTYRWYNSSGTQIATTQNLTSVGKGWYGLKYYGTTAGDVTYQAFVVGTECEDVSITFDPGPDYMDDANIKDWLVGSGTTVANYKSINYGAEPVETAQRAQSTSWFNERTLMRFRLWIDPACQVNTANLTLTGNSHSTAGAVNESLFTLNTSNWSEAGVSFQGRPTSTATGQISIATIPTGSSNLTVDIASFFNNWKTNNPANYGFVFQLQSYASNLLRRMQFNSSDATTPSLRPKIEFSITSSCGFNSYSELITNTDAGFATTYRNILKFFFVEEYMIDAGKKLPLKIYNEDNVAIAGIDFNGSAIPGISLTLPAVNYVTDKNFVSLSLSGLSLTTGKFYTLEFTNTLGEKKYLKFKYTN